MRLSSLILCGLLLMGGCWSPSSDVVSQNPSPTAGAAKAQCNWVRSFNDPELEKLVALAIGKNFTLRSAWSRLAQARALARKAGSEQGVILNGTVGASRGISRMDTPAGRNTVSASKVSLGLAASYEVDVWGRVAATVEAAERDVEASEQDLRAAAITLSADVALTWYRLIEQTQQLGLLDAQVKTNQDSLDLITLRFRSGQIGGTDVLQQKQTLERTRGDREAVRAAIKTYRHQLAVLTGQPPTAKLGVAAKALPTIAPLPPGGMPSGSLTRRPDLRAAERSVAAADRRVAAAMADRFPKISLTMNASTDAERIRDLFDNWAANLAANLIAPILDGGRREAEVDRTMAVLEERVNLYGAKTLGALREVEDALVREQHQDDYLKSLSEQLRLSKRATADIRENYLKGAETFLRYLTTLLQHQELQRRVLRSELQKIEFRIALHRAISGGWELTSPAADPTPPTNPTTESKLK